MKSNKENIKTIILGIDPGSRICGYGAILAHGQRYELIEFGVINAIKKSENLYDRITEINQRLTEVAKRIKPDVVAFETMFYSNNVQSLIKLSHARAAAIIAVTNLGIEIEEYSPTEVKKSVTGRGAASKEQVKFMMTKLLNIKDENKFLDATDALAVAMCHAFKSTHKAGKKTSGSWKDFIKNNPERVV